MTNKEILLSKIKALAEKGVGGEKINAEKMLRKLMDKMGIGEDYLEKNDVAWRLIYLRQTSTSTSFFFKSLLSWLTVRKWE